MGQESLGRVKMKVDASIIASAISAAGMVASARISRPPKPPQPVINYVQYVQPLQPVYVYVMDWLDQVS